MANNTSYTYTISAASASAESNKSSPTTVTTFDKPTGLTATAGYQQVGLSWNAVSVSNLAKYRVYQSTTSGSGYTVISEPTTSSYISTGLTNDTTYYYQVSAVGANGVESNKSNEASAKTYPAGVEGMVYVPAGNFTMGSDSGYSDEKPVHTVYLDAYYIDKYEVTNSQFAGFLSAGNGSHYDSSMKITQSGSTYTAQSGYGNHPVVYVDWNGAKAYCEWAGKRLPTEAEWEKAARGTDGRTYPWGEADPGVSPYRANYYLGTNGAGDGYQETAPVGSFPAGVSPYGAYDMAGNVWEWVADWYSETYYGSSPSSNPQGPSSGTYRVLRGGSWLVNDPYFLRAAYRNWLNPDIRITRLGFRCLQ